jgi:23S rRNA pseudouridine1911/1915/1917 synthase
VKTKFEVATDDEGLRLDQVIPKHVAGLSRRKARAVIDLGGVFVDRTRVKVAGRLVKPGQVIEVNVGGALERSNETPLAPRIVHSDDHIIIVDKPAGLVTAPTPESNRGDLLDQLSRQFGEVYLVHRLDLPTSGLLVFARTRDANKILGDAFKVHDVDREYRAVAVGGIAAQTIDREIEKRRAVTHVEPVETFPRIAPDGSPIIETNADGTPVVASEGTQVIGPDGAPVIVPAGTPIIATHATLLRVRLETGRTHQIRLHLAGLGHPVCGDRTHGGEKERAFLPRPPRLALHAMVLGFVHPATKERVRWEAPLPDDLSAWISRLRRK